MSDPISEKSCETYANGNSDTRSELLSSEVGSVFSVTTGSSFTPGSSGVPPIPPRLHRPLPARRNYYPPKDEEDSLIHTPTHTAPTTPEPRRRNILTVTEDESRPDDPLVQDPPSRYEEINDRGSNLRRNNLLRRRNLLVFGVVSMVLSTTAVVLLGILLLRDKGFQDSIPNGAFKVCVPKFYLDANLKLTQEDDSYCASSNEEVSLLFDIVMAEIKNKTDKTEAESTDEALEPQVPERSHLNALCSLSFNGTSEDCSSQDHSLTMKLEDCGHGIIEGNLLKINSTGFYYVYTRVNLTLTNQNDNHCKAWRHYILRHRLNHPQASGMLVSSVQKWNDNSSHDTMSSFTGGIFMLDEGDFIGVNICHECSSASKPFSAKTDGKTASYLGLVALS